MTDSLLLSPHLSLPDEGPAVHLELRELVGRQDDCLVQQFRHPEVDGQPGGIVSRAVKAQPGAGRGCRHPARLQLGHSGEVGTAGQRNKMLEFKLKLIKTFIFTPPRCPTFYSIDRFNINHNS